MIAIVYLDIDGVLNGRASRGPDVDSDDPIQRARWAMAPPRVRLVDELCRRSGASVVISSSWRLSWTYRDLRAALRAAGLCAPLSGMTWPMCQDRWAAIDRDVRERDPAAWVALDDDTPPAWLADRVVQTDWDAGGITRPDVERALAVLSRGGGA